MFFVPTHNYQVVEERFEEVRKGRSGVEFVVVVAPFGGGKSTIAERLVTQHEDAVYIYFEPRFSIPALVREIAFKISGIRPRSTQACIDLIQEENSRKRRIVLLDEADQAPIKHLNQLRAFHDLYGVAIILLGENSLLSKLTREGRLMSRVRNVIKLEPVTQIDISIYYLKALSLNLTPDHVTKLLRHSNGDFRKVAVDAAKVERLMRANGFKGITDSVINEVCK